MSDSVSTIESTSSTDGPAKSAFEPIKRSHPSEEGSEEPKRQRRSRWASEEEKVTTVPTSLPNTLSNEQRELFALQVQIDEVTRRLRAGDFGASGNEGNRSPSPEPIYDAQGKRVNTREVRTKKKLEEERVKLIERAIKTSPTYKPPSDYRPEQKRFQERIDIPQENHPNINFIGLIIGPRGNSLKKLEGETSTKVMIRGKGSVKEGKAGKIPGNADDENLHALVTGLTQQGVNEAVSRIKKVIEVGISTPDDTNEFKKNQLRELAFFNGTLREEDMKCGNCGNVGHKTFQCVEKRNMTLSITCTNCGGVGHMARDCRAPRNPNATANNGPVQNRALTGANRTPLAEGQEKELLNFLQEVTRVSSNGDSSNDINSNKGNVSGLGKNFPPPPPRVNNNYHYNSQSTSQNNSSIPPWQRNAAPSAAAVPPPPPPPPVGQAVYDAYGGGGYDYQSYYGYDPNAYSYYGYTGNEGYPGWDSNAVAAWQQQQQQQQQQQPQQPQQQQQTQLQAQGGYSGYGYYGTSSNASGAIPTGSQSAIPPPPPPSTEGSSVSPWQIPPPPPPPPPTDKPTFIRSP